MGKYDNTVYFAEVEDREDRQASFKELIEISGIDHYAVDCRIPDSASHLLLRVDYPTTIGDLISGEYEQVLRVVAFNPAEGWPRDASEDIAHELERRIVAEDREVSDGLIDFIEGQLGRKVGTQLTLPLKEA